MKQKNKFDDFEKKRIEALLKILYPNDNIPLREGNVKISEPDGVIKINNSEIGIEVRRFTDDESLHRESAIKEMQTYLNNSLSKLPFTVMVQIDGDKIPIDKRSTKSFMQKVESELQALIPTLKNDCEIEIENIPVRIGNSNEKSSNVKFFQSHDVDSSYFDAVIKAIRGKNNKSYSTKTNWLLLYENTNLAYCDCDFEKLTKEIHSLPIQFENIYLLTSWRNIGVRSPDAFQLFQSFRTLFI